MANGDPVRTRGKCVACDGTTSEDNPVHYFDYWKLNLCKECFIQLSIEQIEELQKEVKKEEPTG